MNFEFIIVPSGATLSPETERLLNVTQYYRDTGAPMAPVTDFVGNLSAEAVTQRYTQYIEATGPLLTVVTAAHPTLGVDVLDSVYMVGAVTGGREAISLPTDLLPYTHPMTFTPKGFFAKMNLHAKVGAAGGALVDEAAFWASAYTGVFPLSLYPTIDGVAGDARIVNQGTMGGLRTALAALGAHLEYVPQPANTAGYVLTCLSVSQSFGASFTFDPASASDLTHPGLTTVATRDFMMRPEHFGWTAAGG